MAFPVCSGEKDCDRNIQTWYPSARIRVGWCILIPTEGTASMQNITASGYALQWDFDEQHNEQRNAAVLTRNNVIVIKSHDSLSRLPFTAENTREIMTLFPHSSQFTWLPKDGNLDLDHLLFPQASYHCPGLKQGTHWTRQFHIKQPRSLRASISLSTVLTLNTIST